MNLKFKILSLIIFVSISTSFAQSNWNPIGLSVSGKNIQNGVEAYYQLNKCNGEDVVFIKFVNNNTSSVFVEWKDAIFTNDQKWVSNQKEADGKSLTINSKETLVGDCSNSSQSTLIVKLNNFIINIDEFKLFRTLSFNVTVIK